MEFPDDIQKYIHDYCRPITKPEWRKGSPSGLLYKNSPQMQISYNTSVGIIKISSCEQYLQEYNYIREYNYEYYSTNYEFWKYNYLNPTGFNLDTL